MPHNPQSTPGHLPRRKKDIGPHKDLRLYVCSIPIHNSQEVEMTQLSINRRTDKQNVPYAYHRILFRHKRE